MANEIDPKSLSYEQLNQVKQQFEEEMENIGESIDRLNQAINRFDASRDAIVALSKETAGTDMLVPLTSSLYVPGKVSDTEHVTVDIGTGYYVEMTMEKAEEHMKRKAELLKTNIARMSAALKFKKKQYQIIMLQMSVKRSEMAAAQAQAQRQAS